VAYTPKFAYSTNQGSNSISEWTINDGTGALTTVAASPIADKNGPRLIAAAPSGAFVYTGNSNNSISEYNVNATTGALTLVSGSPVKGFGGVSALLADPTSSFLFVLDSGKQVIDMYTISAKTGALIFLSSLSTITQARTLALDPTGNIAVVTGSSAVQTYLLVKGVLKRWASATTTNPLSAVAVDQSSQYILLTESSSKTLLTFPLVPAQDVITLTQLSSVPTGNNPSAILAEPSGKYVYVANSGDGTISCYSLNNLTGALKQIGSAVKAAAGTDSLAASNDGKYLYATDKAAGLVSIFKINSTGTLTAAGTATTGTSPTSIVTTGTNQ
jgi:6-phosphogluconolactonase (cycloisomerase 2 family)